MKKDSIIANRIEVLIRDSDFINLISEGRNYWNIPTKGFTGDKEVSKFFKNLEKQDDAFYDSDEYKERYQQLKEKRDGNSFKEYTFKQRQKDLRKLDAKSPLHKYRSQLDKIRVKLDLSIFWTDFIEAYLLFNDINAPLANTRAEFSSYQRGEEPHIVIRVWEHTKLRDVESIWPLVEFHQKKLPGYKQRYKKKDLEIIERDKLVLQKYKEGLSTLEIIKAVEDKFLTEDRLEKDFEEVEKFYLKPANVRKIISRETKND